MTLLFGILNQNKTEEQLLYRVTYGGAVTIPEPVVTAREADEMRIDEIRRVLNRNNVPTATDVDPVNEWDRAFRAMRAVGRSTIEDLREAPDYAQPAAHQANGG